MPIELEATDEYWHWVNGRKYISYTEGTPPVTTYYCDDEPITEEEFFRAIGAVRER